MRDKGDGSVYQRADGRWVGQIEDGYTKTGARAYRRRVRDTETEARRAVRDMLRDLAGDSVDLDPRTTIKRWGSKWLEHQAGVVRPDVLKSRDGHLRNWIVPTIGNRRLGSLTAEDGRKVERAILAADLSPTTAHNVRVTLQTMLNAAVVEGYNIPRPILAAPITEVAESERDAIPLADAVRILDSALHPDTWPDLPDLPPLGRGRKRDKTDVEQYKRRRLLEGTDPSRWTAALLQGMRQGECLGLTWSSVDLKIGTMDISWQLKRYAVDAAVPPGLATRRLDGQYILTAPKTKAGKRIIPLVPWMVTALERWRDLCPESEHDLVWPRPSGGPISKGDDLAAWYGLLDAAGVHKPGPKQWVLHEARHTTVSLLEAAGVPPAVIIAIVGHATYASTRRYSHTELARARAALATVADDLGLPSVKGGKKGKRKAPKPQALTAG